MIYAAEKAITPRATHTCVASARRNTPRTCAATMSWSRTKNESNESRTRRAAYARATEARHPKPSEAPTHFGPPRAVRAACRNLVKHQRILGIPNLSATCGVRPLLAMSVRYLRCQSAIRNVRPQPAVSVRDRRCVGRACKNRHEHTLAKTVTNTRAGSVLFSIPGL